MAVLPRAICRFNAIPIKIPAQFFTKLERVICKFICNNKKHRIEKTILKNKRASSGITMTDLTQAVLQSSCDKKLHGTGTGKDR